MTRPLIVFLAGLLTLLALSCQLPTRDDSQDQAALEDPFFQKPVAEDEVFRILITEDKYILHQVSAENYIYPEPNPEARRLNHKVFQDYDNKWDFMDFTHEGLLRVKLNPQTGKIENVDYEGGKAPRAWQASIMFRDDLLRYEFGFKSGIVQPREFMVRYQWRIHRDPSLTEEEAKKKAREFLMDQKT